MQDQYLDGIGRVLRGRVEKRRALGDYPPGLEQQLEAEFKLIMDAVHRPEVETGALVDRISNVRVVTQDLGTHPSSSSRLPGGRSIHRAGGRIVERHTSALAEQMRRVSTDIADALDEIRRLIEMQREADERQLHELVSAVLDRVAVIDHLADAVIDLERRVGDIEARSAIV